MQGFSTDGHLITGEAHLKQSIQDILTTPIGTRVMRRDYGCRLFDWVDAPLNQETLAEIYATITEALLQWEPRFKLLHIESVRKQSGKLVLDLTGEYHLDQTPIHVKGISV